MGRTVTSKKQKKSRTKFLKVHEPYASKELKNAKLVQDTLLDCIKNGDLGSFREVLIAYLVTANKTSLAKKAGIGRQTLYDLIDLKKKFNPELSTVSAVIHAIAA